MPSRVYRSRDQLDFAIEDLPLVDLPHSVLLTSPDFFEVSYVINPHMEGHVGSVDQDTAETQWNALRAAYERLGFDVHVLDGRRGLPDMVFCANQTLPFLSPHDGEKSVMLSRMHAAERRPEIGHYQDFFAARGYRTIPLEMDGLSFEGMGDALWHGGRLLLWGGHGFRTDLAAYERLSDVFDVPVCVLSLEDPDFYHLDTCLSVLDENTALVFPGAFRDEGMELIEALFSTVIRAPEAEARELFACNAHCPDRRHVLIQRGCKETLARLREAGFVPVELETGEFLKAGGSVYCMKQMFW